MNFKKYAVVGHPAGHSMSPFIHSRLFALCGQQAEYRAEDIPALSTALPWLRGLAGFNVTIPYKQEIIPFLDAVQKKAAAAGSVNTVKQENGRLTGYTTDGDGFRRSLEAEKVSLRCRAAVLGAGGAARAVVTELALAGGTVTVATRPHSAAAAEKLCADVQKNIPGARIRHCLFSELSGQRDLLVNTTPVGMYPKTGVSPVSEEIIENSACVFDAVYNPGETELLRFARRHGKKAVSGVGMLVGQAAAAEEIWFGADFSESDLRDLQKSTAFEMKKKFGNIVLCGFMGCGKTTVGRLLAEALGRDFVDLDEWIERKEGMPVAEIFHRKGESGFRNLEKEASRTVSEKSRQVIAAGGGTLLDAENAAALGANGIILFLDAPLDAIRTRLAGDCSRPLLRGGQTLEQLYQERLERYRTVSNLSLDAGRPAGEVAQEAALRLKPAF